MNCSFFKADQAIQTLYQLTDGLFYMHLLHNQFTNIDVEEHSLLCVCACVKEGKCVCVCAHTCVCEGEREREKQTERALNQRRTTEEEEKRGRAICFVRACL